MAQDQHRQAKERFDDAQEAIREQHERMREDLRFSNPSDPQQWDDQAKLLRKGRPCLTFDRTNQFISQVVNDARQNKPAINCLPADSKADIAVAEKLNGIVRHIEYVSRAGIAYDTAIEYAARIGLGWMRVVPEIMRPETNEQEIRIKRVHDPLSICLDPGSTEPDGSDAMYGFAETNLTKRAFKAQYPKAKETSWEANGWFTDKEVRIAEYFVVKEEKKNMLSIQFEGQSMTMGEDEYWQLRQQTGMEIPAQSFVAKTRAVKWCKLSGVEILEETDFPSQYLPLIPVIGYEIWVDGKRYLCGMTRRLMDGQRAYNYERSAFIESVALQPKAPFMAPAEAIENYEDQWAKLNQGNPAYIPYNAYDENNNPIPMPARQMPPAFPVAFAQGGEIAGRDMEAAIGTYDANLGNQGTAVSGKAKLADQKRGDTANFHYMDNLSRSIEQLGRVIVDMIPRIYDTARQARIVGQDGTQDFVAIDPSMPEAVQKQGKKVVAINLNVGAYDVRVKTGPSYTTLRQEQAEGLERLITSSPDVLGPILTDLWIASSDMPDSEKARKRVAATLPPVIQQMEAEDGPDIPPEALAQINSMQQQLQEMQAVMQEAGQELQAAKAQAETAKIAAAKASLDTKQVSMQLEAERISAQLKEEMAGEPVEPPEDHSVEIERAKLQAEKAIFEEHKRNALLEIENATLRAQAKLEGAAHSLDDQAHGLEKQAIGNEISAQGQQHKLDQQAQKQEPKEEPKKDDSKEFMGQLVEVMKASQQQMAELQKLMKAPKKIKLERDETGRAVGATSSL